MPDAPILAMFGTSFLVGLLGAASPGPLLAFNIREAVRHGFLAGPFVATGHALLELVVVIILALGLTQVLGSSMAVAVIGILGGAFLLWMAWGMLRHPDQGAPGASEHGHRTAGHQVREPVMGGVLVSLSNPYWTVWWVTVGAALMTRSLKLGTPGVVAFYVGHIMADFAWYTLVAAALASGRRLITPKVYAGIMMACGAFLAVIGGYFIVTGARLLA